ncbi:MAG: 2Fe-2S iron-sulfur cluster binding domain-containing protein [Candidatus Omnitrophica bacterium]|nr:2Fe-2S iron-sulfur cluster binding domain-containing protein [Candidatus Omnitrophota bacterium]
MPKLMFRDKKVTVEIAPGVSILDAALEHGVGLYHTCGGNCSCSTCCVVVLKGAENLSAMEPPEAEILDSFDLKPPYRLGCQAQVMGGEVEVEIPLRSREPRPNKTPPAPID